MPMRVFISHTAELRAFPPDRSFVQAAENAVSRAGDVVALMEFFAASSLTPAEAVRQAVLASDVYVGLLGFRYGAVIPGEPSMSYTELEFKTATEAGIPRLMFLLDESAPLPASAITAGDPTELQRQFEFRQRVTDSGLLAHTFATPDQLEVSLLHSLQDSHEEGGHAQSHRARRSVLILCSERTRDLGMLLARELSPDVLVWPVELGLSAAGGGAEGLLSLLKDVELAVILPANLPRGQKASAQEWFEIGTVVGSLGASRTFLVAPNAEEGTAAAWMKLPSLPLSLREVTRRRSALQLQ